MSEDCVRVLRLVEYEGPRYLVEKQIKASLHGTRLGLTEGPNYVRITAATLDEFPRVIEEAQQVSLPEDLRRAINEAEAWKTDTYRHIENEQYYRGLLVQIGEMFGNAAKIQDDGGMSENILCLKVPELVAKLMGKQNG